MLHLGLAHMANPGLAGKAVCGAEILEQGVKVLSMVIRLVIQASESVGLVGNDIARIDLAHIIAGLERRLATVASAIGLVFDECVLQRLPSCGTPRCRTFGGNVLLNADFEALIAVILRLIQVSLHLTALRIASHEDR